jgi:hypothetical protein
MLHAVTRQQWLTPAQAGLTKNSQFFLEERGNNTGVLYPCFLNSQ